MANGEKQIGVKIDEQLWKQFRQDVSDRKGRVHGHLKSEVETALREYINASAGGDTNDRLTRLEHQMDKVVGLLEESQPKKENSDVGSRVESSLEDVIETINKEADGAPRVHDSVIEMAIESHAGYSDPTIKQYKNLLRKRNEAFPDPRSDSSYHYLDSGVYCQAVNQMVQEREIKQKQYIEIVEEQYSREWWSTQLEKVQDGDDGSVAFQ